MARPIPLEIRERLNKLLLLLGSNHEGESAAAAGKITALLKRHNLDWHDIVSSIDRAARSAPQPPPPNAKTPGGQQVMTAAALHQLIHQIMRSPLNERARRFLAGMQDHADTFGSVKFSDLQWHWLMDLAKRAKVS